MRVAGGIGIAADCLKGAPQAAHCHRMIRRRALLPGAVAEKSFCYMFDHFCIRPMHERRIIDNPAGQSGGTDVIARDIANGITPGDGAGGCGFDEITLYFFPHIIAALPRKFIIRLAIVCQIIGRQNFQRNFIMEIIPAARIPWPAELLWTKCQPPGAIFQNRIMRIGAGEGI